MTIRRLATAAFLLCTLRTAALAVDAVDAARADEPPRTVELPRAVQRAIASSFVIRLPKPLDDGRVRLSQGAGALLRDGRLLSALHVFVDADESVRGERWSLLPEQSFVDATVLFATEDNTPLKPLAEGSASVHWESDDLIAITPDAPIRDRRGVKVARDRVEPNEPVTFVGLSERRGGEFVARRSYVTIRATSSPHFFVFGESVPGDSGGPIFNDRGELVGLIISSGEHGTAIDVQTDMTRPEKKVLVSTTRAPGIIAVDVAKLLRGD